MSTKCIGIISYFPDNPQIREERIRRFNELLVTLNDYFKLPIVIIAQNWKDFKISISYSNDIIVYNYSDGLGITKARLILRDKLLKLNYDYFILLDDDSNIQCNEDGVSTYFKEIDSHPGMVGVFNGLWFRLMAISKLMLQLMDFDFIKNYEASRGEVWEDVAYIRTYRTLYPHKWFRFSKKNMKEISQVSKNDIYTTWYKKEFGDERIIRDRTNTIVTNWVAYKRR